MAESETHLADCKTEFVVRIDEWIRAADELCAEANGCKEHRRDLHLHCKEVAKMGRVMVQEEGGTNTSEGDHEECQ